MRRSRSGWIVVTALLLAATPVRADLRAQIDALLRDATAKQQATLAARVVQLPGGNVLYSFRAAEPMKPASNMKLLTTAAALDRLGAEFAFETTLARCGDDLVVIGGGDPATGDPRLAERAGVDRLALFDRWAKLLRDQGLAEVRGRLVLDASIFDEQLVHPSWPTNQLQNWYAAPVAGLNLNDNCIDVTVWPADTPGEPAMFSVWPPNRWVQIDNRCISGGGGPPIIGRIGDLPRYVLNGRCSSRGTLQAVAVPDPVLLFADSLRTRLAAGGVRVLGQTVRRAVRDAAGALPAECVVLDVAATPMRDVLARCNQNSQNLFAECVFKRLGAAEGQASGTRPAQGGWANGRRAVERFLTSLNVETSGVVVDDGSGLSHANRVSALVLTEVLRYMFGHPAREAYMASLAGPGDDGTFERRLTELEGRLFVKTGTIRGVSTLSGYVRTADDTWLCFSLLFNDVKGSTRPLHGIQDDFCRLLAAHRTSATTAPVSP